MSIADDIAKLNDLRQSGALSELEYQEAKDSLLTKNRTFGQRVEGAVREVSSDVNMWGMFIHLAQFCGYVVPIAGMVVPIVLWQIKKDESEIIDRHGRIVANWILTELILGIVCGLLCFIVIGIPLIMALAVVGVVFPIIGAVKANNGEVWHYPYSFVFFAV
jgi:uncharacterized protein